MAFCKFCGQEITNGVCNCPEAVAERNGQNSSYDPNNGYSPNSGYDQNDAYGQNNGYGATDGYVQNNGYGANNSGYDPNNGYGAANGYSQNNGYGPDSGYGQNNGYDPNNGYGAANGYGTNNGASGGQVSAMREMIEKFKQSTGINEAVSDTYDPFERNVPIVPDCIDAEENEIVVKQYNIARMRTRLKFERAECRMMVTNRRILFRASGTAVRGNVLQEHQFNLDKISGIEIHQNYRFSILSLVGCLLLMMVGMFLPTVLFQSSYGARGVIIGLAVAVVCAVPLFVMYKRFWLKSFLLDIGAGGMMLACTASYLNKFVLFLFIVYLVLMVIGIFIVCFVPNLVVRIKSTTGGAAVALGNQSAMFKRSADEENTGFAEVLPWEDTAMAINELGTLIEDLQKQGDYAVEKWSR